jgi:uncharacterized protein
MARAAGTADLPLHHGRVPPWLARRMASLGATIAEAIILEYGRSEFLSRLAHPFWFQSFGAVMGMDWHSSGITTSVLGALKRGLASRAHELGLHVCGGRGNHSRRTPDELLAIGNRTGLDGAALARTSRLVAKVDSAAVQDGYALYLHGFIVADDGQWTVVQQGMNGDARTARRYHWRSDGLSSFVDSPHRAIEGQSAGSITNLADTRAAESRAAQLRLLATSSPEAIVRALRSAVPAQSRTARTSAQLELLPALTMPSHHEVREGDVHARRLHAAIAAAMERGPVDFPELLLTPGVGARTVLSLALVAEVLHGAPHRFTDPARFSFAHGGKDGHPFPVPTLVYDRTITVMRQAIASAKLGQRDRLDAMQRLDAQARLLEGRVTGSSVSALIDGERERSWMYGGRTVNGWAQPPGGQLGAYRRSSGSSASVVVK